MNRQKNPVEVLMLNPILSHLSRQGYHTSTEVSVGSSLIDVSAYRKDRGLISIELKHDKWRQVLHQATRNLNYFDFSYIAMPSKRERIIRKNLNEFTRMGIGIYMVDGKEARLLVGAKKSKIVDQRQNRFITKRVCKKI